MTKYIFVTGGVVSSIGKGISAAAIGQLLKLRGLKVYMQKFDPYINVDPGNMSPYQHGEIFVTDDGAETDLDLGHYERFIDENLNKFSSITTGKIYKEVIEKERRGDYEGGTVQVIPHITDQIKKKLTDITEHSNPDIVITEIGGTVGDIESLPFLEAIRQVRQDIGYKNTLYIHQTLVPYIKAASEMKTKPTQHSVKELRSLGIQPDFVVLRSEEKIPEELISKIALFSDVQKEHIFESNDVSVLYEIIINLHKQKIDDKILKHFRYPDLNAANVSEWEALVHRIKSIDKELTITLVGRYIELRDAYLSVNEALNHAGIKYKHKIKINWVDAEKISEKNVGKFFSESSGLIVPGGFSRRATPGKITAIKYARENKIPFFGINYGMQLALIEFARNVLNLKEATTTELDPKTSEPLINDIKDHLSIDKMGRNLRIGLSEFDIKSNTKAFNAYLTKQASERHRYSYQFNNDYLEKFENSKMILSGFNSFNQTVEIVELEDHPWFLAVQYHPEFLSRPLRPHPLFSDYVKAVIKYSENNNK